MSSWLEYGPDQLSAVAASAHCEQPARRVAALLGLGAALPVGRLTNAEVVARLGIEESWIEKRTGILERRRMGPGDSLVALGSQAAQRALDDAGVSPGEVDLLVAATVGSDDVLPNFAPLVAGEIGAHKAGAFDIGAGCVGFVAALPTAAAAVESGRARHAVVLAAEHMTRWIDYDDRNTAALFGDGAAAVVLGPGSQGVGAVILGAEASEQHLVGIPGDGGAARDGRTGHLPGGGRAPHAGHAQGS